MDLNQAFDIVSKNGMGVASFVVLLYGMWKASQFATTFITNHWAHFEQNMYAKLDTIIDLLKSKQP